MDTFHGPDDVRFRKISLYCAKLNSAKDGGNRHIVECNAYHFDCRDPSGVDNDKHLATAGLSDDHRGGHFLFLYYLDIIRGSHCDANLPVSETEK